MFGPMFGRVVHIIIHSMNGSKFQIGVLHTGEKHNGSGQKDDHPTESCECLHERSGYHAGCDIRRRRYKGTGTPRVKTEAL